MMHDTSTEDDYTITLDMSDTERLEYFVSRSAAVEEVWVLGNEAGWVMRENGDITSLPVWPYQKFAQSCAVGEWGSQEGSVVSLEHFVFKILRILMEQQIQVEIMPTAEDVGFLIDPQSLFRIFESTIESGEYFIEQW